MNVHYIVYAAGWEDSRHNVWDIGSWPAELQDTYQDGHWDRSWGSYQLNLGLLA